MTSVPLGFRRSPPRIDHFSSLPNELLDDIFELAHYHPNRPLSKRLLPFFEPHLYRNIDLYSLRQCSRFLRSIAEQPHRSELVRTLSLPHFEKPKRAYLRFLEDLFPLLSNLLHLDFHRLHVFFNPDITGAKLPPSLRSLTTILVSNDDSDPDTWDVDLNQLAKLADLPNLTKLTILRWQSINYTGTLRPTWSTTVQTLRIEGVEIDDDEATEFLAGVCPELKHLELYSDFDTSSSTPNQFGVQSYSSSLESLSLTIDERKFEDSNSDIERFTQLRSLTLGDSCYSDLLPAALSFMPLLVDITLGKGEISPFDWQPLVSGPTRLEHLKTLKLDIATAQRGWQIGKPSTTGFEGRLELDRCPVDMKDGVCRRT